MEITIQVKSSGDKPYDVIVSKNDDGLSIFCNCQAGIYRKLCKHKLAIISADKKMLYSESQLNNLNNASKWISKTKYPTLVAELRKQEKELEIARKTLKNQKDKISVSMKEGI